MIGKSLIIFFAVLFMQGFYNKGYAETTVLKRTYLFSIEGKDTLFLDKYEDTSSIRTVKRPVILFIHGGGFRGGSRDRSDYLMFFRFLAKQGFVVVTSDYRTILKEQKFTSKNKEYIIHSLQRAINTAVDDMFKATEFIINHDHEWHIDTNKIIAIGSSAGAITVLQAEYCLANKVKSSAFIPQTFNYAGIISLSGAILGGNLLSWNNKSCPIMLFHGDADRIVPYKRLVINDKNVIWGTSAITKSLTLAQLPFYSYTVINAGHEIADSTMRENKYDMVSFINEQIFGKKNRTVITEEKNFNSISIKKDFTIEDYLESNFQ